MNKKMLLLIIVTIITIFSSNVYAYSNQKIKIPGEQLNIKYSNIKIEKSQKNNISLKDDNIYFNCYLSKPGEYFEFTVDIENNSNYNARIENIEKTSLSTNENKYLNYIVKYIDNSTIKIGDHLLTNQKVTVKIRVEYKLDIEKQDLPQKDQDINLFFNLNYIEDN